MENAKIQKVSSEELKNARMGSGSAQFSNGSFSGAKNVPESLSLGGVQNVGTAASHKNYIKALKKEGELVKHWFKPFGYISHEHLDSQIYVDCKNFEVLFDDFNLVANEKPTPAGEQTEQDELLSATLDDLDTNLSMMLEEYVAIRLGERFPSYGNERLKFKTEAYNEAYKRFANNSKNQPLTDVMFEIKNRQTSMAGVTEKRNYYGVYPSNSDGSEN